MIVSAIVATDQNNLIGIGKDMPWHLPKDFAYFKATTIEHPIIMGRITHECLGKVLPKRTNITVSRDFVLAYEGVVTVTSIEDAIAVAESEGTDECFIIGGGQIYKEALEKNLIDKLYITKVHTEIKTKNKKDLVYFPEISHDDWDMVSIKTEDADDNNEYNMTFMVFEKN